jgi:hypothetical protein
MTTLFAGLWLVKVRSAPRDQPLGRRHRQAEQPAPPGNDRDNEGQALVRSLPIRSRSVSNSAAKEVSLVRRRTLNWPSARWPVSTMRRR